MLLIFAPRSTVQDVFTAIFIPWTLILILAKPFCKEWHQLWGVTQHCCEALCSYLSGPRLPHHDILSILTRPGPTSIRSGGYIGKANLPLYSIQVSAFTCEWVRECERLWKAVGHPGRRWHCDAEWSPPIFSANSPKDINVGTSSFQGAPSSIDKMHWLLDILSQSTRDFTHRTCRAVKQFPRETTGTVSPSWLHVSIVYQCSMHVVTTASHVEQYFLNTQWISSLMRSLWEQIWLGTIWLWEHFWFLSQPLRSGGNRQILGGCWTKSNCGGVWISDPPSNVDLHSSKV